MNLDQYTLNPLHNQVGVEQDANVDVQNDSLDQHPPTDVSHKMDLMMLSNAWNDKNERIVISIGENAASYKWMHEKTASSFHSINQILTIVLLVFSTGLSAETIIPDDKTNTGLNVTRRIFTYIVTFLSVLLNFLRYEKASQQHRTTAIAYSQLYHNIQQQMCMFRRNRTNATKYIPAILKEYDSLVISAPEIDPYVIRKFKNTFKNADISLPDIADRIQKIEIINESPPPTPMLRVDAAVAGVNNNSRTANVQYGRYGVCNLDQIHNAFQIHGDISDRDIENAKPDELRELRQRGINERSNYEFQRFITHASEND